MSALDDRRSLRRLGFALMSACGLAALAWASFVRPLPRVIYNPSDSVPRGWYRVGPVHALHVGSLVLIRLPAIPAAVAVQRGYLPMHVPLLKRIGAIPPQVVCVHEGVVRIDGLPVAATLPADGLGRTLLPWPSCRPLVEGELFLLSLTNPASFDSRYFGPVPASAVIREAQPIHTGSQQ